MVCSRAVHNKKRRAGAADVRSDASPVLRFDVEQIHLPSLSQMGVPELASESNLHALRGPARRTPRSRSPVTCQWRNYDSVGTSIRQLNEYTVAEAALPIH